MCGWGAAIEGLQFFEKASLACVPRPTDKVVEDKAPSKILGKAKEGNVKT